MRLHKYNFHTKHINMRNLALALTLLFSSMGGVSSVAFSESRLESLKQDPNFACSDIKLVYARESGAELHSLNYERFTTAFLDAFKDSNLSVSIYELGTKEGGYDGNSYPSPGVGIETWQRFKTSIGAYISAGETYSYGKSVKEGSREAIYFIENYKLLCPTSKVVMAGYSQGAQVVSLSLQSLDASLVYAALTFGDPKLYLPEGKFNPITYSTPACSEGRSAYSIYRANVPDCYAYQGILGGYIPYQSSPDYDGKLKAYCQYHDIICSAYLDLDRWYSGHASYKETGAYNEASKAVYNMIQGIEESPTKNLAILFDSTDSMQPFIGKYKDDTIKTAKKVLSEGGKVSLYTFSDLNEKNVEELCDFSTCSSDNITDLINNIGLQGGGDEPESALSASFTVMKRLNWDAGANKSLLIVTDAPFLNPDRDGITEKDVQNLSYSIDPVNIYVLTNPENENEYKDLTSLTNGKVYTTENYNPLEAFESDLESALPSDPINAGSPIVATTSSISLKKSSNASLSLAFETDGVGNVLVINGDIMGYLTDNSVEITDVDFFQETTVCLAPVSTSGFRGELSCESFSGVQELNNNLITIPKAPKTGKK